MGAALTDDEWKALIANAVAARSIPLKMFTYRNKSWPSWSKPVVLAAENGTEFVVKSPRIGVPQSRAIVTEQIVSILGMAIGAPVGEVFTVEVPKALVDINPVALGAIGPGVCHGSKRIANTSERAMLAHVDLPANRTRFAAIAVLYGWMPAADHQLIYDLSSPFHVHSVDHGFFFAGGPNWTEATLGAAAAAACDTTIVNGCKLSSDELRATLERVRDVRPEVLANAVARPPDEWGISPAERLAVAKYLAARQATLSALI